MTTEKTIITDAELSRMMHEHGIRPSLHRMAVLSNIVNTRKHPTADDIFSELSRTYPTMSRTTVYNSLHLMVEKGMIKEVDIDNGVQHYDYALQPPHSHFLCRRCGRIIDVITPTGIMPADTDEFEIDSMEVTFKGLCKSCKETGSGS